MDPDPLDRLEDAAELVARRAQRNTNRMSYERGNRLGLLWVHSLVSLLAGVQMLLFGSATQIEHIVGPESRLVMGPLGLAGGLLLALGLTRKPQRSIPLEAAGLALVALWDLAMTVGLAVARWTQHDYVPLGVHQPQPPGYVPAYPVAVYGGLLALLVIHLLTLRHVWDTARPNQKAGESHGTD